MTRSYLKPLLLAAGLLIAGGSLAAQSAPASPQAAPAPRGGLDLSDAQKASMKAVFAKHRDAMHADFQAAHEAGKALHAGLKDPSTSVDALRALHQKVSDAQFNLLLERRAIHQEVQGILTPDQQARMASWKGHHRHHRGGMGQGMGMGF